MIESIDMTTEKGVAWGPDWQCGARFVGMCLSGTTCTRR